MGRPVKIKEVQVFESYSPREMEYAATRVREPERQWVPITSMIRKANSSFGLEIQPVFSSVRLRSFRDRRKT